MASSEPATSGAHPKRRQSRSTDRKVEKKPKKDAFSRNRSPITVTTKKLNEMVKKMSTVIRNAKLKSIRVIERDDEDERRKVLNRFSKLLMTVDVSIESLNENRVRIEVELNKTTVERTPSRSNESDSDEEGSSTNLTLVSYRFSRSTSPTIIIVYELNLIVGTFRGIVFSEIILGDGDDELISQKKRNRLELLMHCITTNLETLEYERTNLLNHMKLIDPEYEPKTSPRRVAMILTENEKKLIEWTRAQDKETNAKLMELLDLLKINTGNPQTIFEWLQAQNQKIFTKLNEWLDLFGNRSLVDSLKNVAADIAKHIKIEP